MASGGLQGEELFEVFDEANERSLGLVPRSEVHRRGLLHRSVNVFLVLLPHDDLAADAIGGMSEDPLVLLQKRAANKDIAPGEWDLSVGEHLQPHERFISAAVRGVLEELGLHVEETAMHALHAPAPFFLDLPDKGVHDHEYQAAFVTFVTVPPKMALQESEVADVRWVKLSTLIRAWQGETKDDDVAMVLTPWFRNELALLSKTNLSALRRPPI